MTDTARKGLVFETSISVAFDILHAIKPLNTKLNPICHLLSLLGAHPILHVSRIRINQMNVWCTLHSCCLTSSLN
jgi:hypothetical protein